MQVAELVGSVRKGLELGRTEMAVQMAVSESAIRHYEAGRREPDALFFWRLAAIAPASMRLQIEERLPAALRGIAPLKVRGRRYSEETILAAHEALDLVLDHAAPEMVRAIQEILDKHATQWRKD